ncbi:sialate O-acetylesterase [Seramator thermalis]|uniref:sialate O-acetylesterase n=1 Tax=Seramator thermalis TaxID=2496270 RepID=UPI00101B9B28|nr:sialate O-acetylesterase [Seramator thermalis]
MKIKILPLLLLLMLTNSLGAKILLPEIMSDNMILQQNTKVNLWGKSDPGKTVEIRPSWTSEITKVKVDAKGNWIASVATPAASFTPYTITFSDGEKLTLKNILIGEVWLASGQSNMEMPLNGFWNNLILKANETIAMAGQNKGMRFVTIPKTAAMTPQETVKGTWKECNSENAPWFSATAYHFAQMLYRTLNVPVGIIVSSWGGTRVEGWINREILETYPDIDLSEKAINELNPMARPMLMYNAMIHPLIHYTIKGFIWYQGESNVGKHDVYAERLANMVNLWRKDWGLGDLPFYYVEIAPWIYGDGETGTSGALLREAQFKTQSLIPNSGMISTNDLVKDYEKTNIHPRNKIDVGKRLAFLALSQTYGLKGIASHGPEYKSMEIKDGKIYLSFNYAEDGFSRAVDIKGFEIAGEDHIFYPAKVEVDLNNRILIVSNENISKPVAARYCFKNFQIGNLYNTRELPVVPFRTDNFEK